jgi:hypothetical protein
MIALAIYDHSFLFAKSATIYEMVINVATGAVSRSESAVRFN